MGGTLTSLAGTMGTSGVGGAASGALAKSPIINAIGTLTGEGNPFATAQNAVGGAGKAAQAGAQAPQAQAAPAVDTSQFAQGQGGQSPAGSGTFRNTTTASGAANANTSAAPTVANPTSAANAAATGIAGQNPGSPVADPRLTAVLSDPAQRGRLPAGMRNNNPGNIKFTSTGAFPGVTGPSVNTDQGDPQAVFASPEAGMAAMHSLLARKYNQGKVTPDQMIAGNMGWTPGNHEAAANVARYMGIGPNDDINFNDPARAGQFMRALMMQEHGGASKLYTDNMIASAVKADPSTFATSVATPQGPSTTVPSTGNVDIPQLQAQQRTPQQRVLMALMNQKAQAADGSQPTPQTPEEKVMAELLGGSGGAMGRPFHGGQQQQPQQVQSMPAVDTGEQDIAQVSQANLQRVAAAGQSPKAVARRQALAARLKNQKVTV